MLSEVNTIRSLRLVLVPPVIAIAALAFFAHSSPARAQSENPNVVSFLPSPQHASTLPTGQPVVSRYELTFYKAGTTERVMTIDLGKPAPQPDGVIRLDYTNRLGAWPLPGVECDARVTAVGADGTSTSDPSNTFIYECTFRLSTTSDSVAASGGSGMVELAAGALCGWSASSSTSWITITSGTSDVGTGWVGYTVAPNTSPSTRSGTLTIAGLTYTVTQAAGSAQANVPPTVSITKPANGSSVRVGNPTKVIAEAFDADGIAKVEFYANGRLFATAFSPTYRATWTMPSTGTHTLTAVVEDRLGARTTSAPISVRGR